MPTSNTERAQSTRLTCYDEPVSLPVVFFFFCMHIFFLWHLWGLLLCHHHGFSFFKEAPQHCFLFLLILLKLVWEITGAWKKLELGQAIVSTVHTKLFDFLNKIVCKLTEIQNKIFQNRFYFYATYYQIILGLGLVHGPMVGDCFKERVLKYALNKYLL